MSKYIARRVLALIPQLLIILALVVVMVDLTPGDVIDSMLGDSGQITPEARARLERSLGLDKSLPARYVSYLGGVLQGDLGTSITRQRPVTDMISERMFVTAELTMLAVLVSILIGIPLGMAAAVARGKVTDYAIRFFAVLFLGIPSFLVATMMVLLPSLWFRWRPPLYVPLERGVFLHFFSMLLPVVAVSLVFMATNVRMMRSSFIDVMQQEVRHTFSGAMPFSIYTLCSGFVSTLLVKNFTLYDDGDFTAFTHAQFCALLLALCMGLHPCLGQHCPLLALQDDVLQCICAQLPASQLTKHIVFHAQEQWLVA